MQIACSNIIENTVTKRTLHIPAYRKTHVMYKKIIRAVHIHRKSIQLVFILFNFFYVSFIIINVAY